MVRRREFLAAILGAAIPRPETSLQALAAARGLGFGSMVEYDHLVADPLYTQAIRQECGMVVPGLEAKWAATEPADGAYAFRKLDAVATFAERNHQALRLHNLVWGVWNPAWLDRALAQGRGEKILSRHIAAVASRYRGRARAWDVLNEPADPRWPSGPEGLCRIPWRNALGPRYVDLAFHAAHEADPSALLFVNDDFLEYDDSEAKRVLYLRLIEQWRARGVPIHGFGLQAHLRPDKIFDARRYRRFLSELAGMGLVIHITELDVRDTTLPADTGARDRIVAGTASRYLEVALDEPAVKALIVWGLSDRYSPLDRDAATRRPDKLPARGAPLDQSFRPKPFRDAIARALAHAASR